MASAVANKIVTVTAPVQLSAPTLKINNVATPGTVALKTGDACSIVIDPVPGANGYTVYGGSSSGNYSWNSVYSSNVVSCGPQSSPADMYFIFKANGANGVQSPPSAEWHLTFNYPQSALSSPTPIVTSTGSNSLSISWNSVSGAGLYSLWRSTSNNPASATQIQCITGTTFTDSGSDHINPSTAYYYWVKAASSDDGALCGVPSDAKWAGFSSSGSATTSQMTLAAPTLKINNVTTPGAVTLNGGDNCSIVINPVPGAISYVLSSGPSSGNYSYLNNDPINGTTISCGTASPYDVYFVVKANGQNGTQSGPSSEWHLIVKKSAGPIMTITPTDSSVSSTATMFEGDEFFIQVKPVAGAVKYKLYFGEKPRASNGGGYPSNMDLSADGYKEIASVFDIYLAATAVFSNGIESEYSTEWHMVAKTKPITIVSPTPNVTATGPNSLNISWNSVSGAGLYSLWRSTSNNPASATQIQCITGSSVTDSGSDHINPSMTYYYWVKAASSGDGALCGNATDARWSGFSSVGSAVTTKVAPVAPNPPGAPTIVATGANSVKIAWNSVNGAALYSLVRPDVSNVNKVVQIYCGPNTSYDDSGNSIKPNATLSYYVRAATTADGALCNIDPQAVDPSWSGYSPKGSITIPNLGQALSSPTITAPGSTVIAPVPNVNPVTAPGSTVTTPSNAVISAVLNWNSVPNANAYRIQFGTNSSFDTSVDGTTCNNCIYNETSSSSSYRAMALVFGTKYYWRVRAENTALNSGWLPSSWATGEFVVTSSPLAGIALCDSKCAYQNHGVAQLSAAIYNTFQTFETTQNSNPVTGPGSSTVTTPSSSAVYNGKVGFWKLDDELYVDDLKTGFVGGVFVNDMNQKVVVAYRGTEITWDDITTDIEQFVILPAQYSEALDLAKKAKEKYGTDTKSWKEKVLITGHSLGGGMAQYVAATLGLKAVGFNSAGLSYNSVLEAQKSPEYSVADITHVISADYSNGLRDVVSNHFTLLGKANGVNVLLPNLDHVISNLHSMDNLLQHLDENTTAYLNGKVEPFFTTLETKYSGIMGGHSKSILFQDAYYRQYENGALFGAYEDEFYYLLPYSGSVLTKFGTLDSAMSGLQ